MADLATNLSTAFSAVGADVKKLLAQDGNLSTLTTKQKASLVVAINELDAAIKAIDVKSVIDDMASDATHAWSAQKVGSEITEKCNAVKDAILGGAGEAYDTLQELATLMTTNKDAIAALQTIAAGHVRFDEAQTLSEPQKKQARDNIGAVSSAELSAVSGVANAAKSAATQNATAIGTLGSLKTAAKGDLVSAINEVKGKADEGVAAASAAQSKAGAVEGALNTFKGQVGDTGTDFALAYTTARDALSA